MVEYVAAHVFDADSLMPLSATYQIASTTPFETVNGQAHAVQHGVFWPDMPVVKPFLRAMTPSIATGIILHNGSAVDELTITESFVINGLTTSAPARVRLYTSTEKRDADLLRPVGTSLADDHGLLFEAVTMSTMLSLSIAPGVYIFAEDASIPIAITNISGATDIITVTFTAVGME